MRLLDSLKHRPFALIWSGQTLSRVGDHLYQIALAWWVLQKTGSASQMGMVLVFSFTPMLLFLLLGGVAVDRFARLRIMFLSDLGRGAIVSVVALLAYSGRLEIWHLYVLSFAFGVVDAFFLPAYTAAVPEMTPAEALSSANSLTSLSAQAGRVVGPALGAAFISAGGTSLAFAINGASFFVAAAFMLPLLSSARPPRTETHKAAGVTGELLEGFKFVRRAPWLWMTIALVAVVNVALAGPYSVSLPFLIKARGESVRTLGLVYAMFPVGYAISAAGLGQLRRIPRRGPLAYAGIIVAGLALLLFGLRLPIALLAGAAVVNGMALEAFGLIWTHTLQERVPPGMLGRVSSIDSLGSTALLPLGFALAGWLTDAAGAPAVLIAGGGVTALLATLALLHPAIRQWD